MKGKTVWCLDANSLIFQVFHAIPEMTSPLGEPVNALFGFTRDLLFLLEQKKPDYLLCAFDLPGPTFRDQLYAEYKATRSAMPEDLVPQFPKIHQVLEALRIPLLSVEGYEADDILATVARMTEEQGGRCFLVSGDKDCRQLITDQVQIYNLRKHQVFDRQSLQEEWGVRPEQVVDFQALVGDSVDNVPGVPGIGPKIAQQLLAQFGTLDEVLDHADQVSGAKRQQMLKENRQLALLSRQLVRLDAQVPLDLDWRRDFVQPANKQQAVQLFEGFGFRGFAAQARRWPDDPADAGLFPREGNQRAASGSLSGETSPQGGTGGVASSAAPWAGDEDARSGEGASDSIAGTAPALPPSTAVPWQARYELIDTPDKLDHLLAQLREQRQVSLDTETTHIWPAWAELVGISLAWQEGEAYYLPVKAPEGDPCLELAPTLEKLRPILEDPRVGKVGQNLKYDLIVLRRAGIQVRGIQCDTMVASYLLDAGQRNHNLDELAQRYLGHQNITIESLIGHGSQQKRMDEVSVRAVCDYAAEDADVALRLVPLLEPRLEESHLGNLFRELELPLIDVLVEMESTGIRVDVARLSELSEQFGQRLTTIEQEIYQLAGRELNIASPKQLQEVLFTQLGLPVVKKTKTGPSTDAEVLEELARQHELPAKILEYRQYAKLKGTYVDALPAMVNPQTGRVHASFNQVVAATGRLSSHDPNLQNIPIRSESGRQIRSAFLPGRDDWFLLGADYSQIELRVLAHFSGDETLCTAFAHDEDIHTLVASQVNGVPLEEVTPEMRSRAKAVNFGVIYGQSPFGLSRQLNISQEEAAAFIDAYFARYPGVEVFLGRVLEECRRSGYVSTILGRRRSIQGIRPDARRQRNPPERTAVNTVIQGSAADLIKQAMISVAARLRTERFGARMLLQIHDELIWEVPPDELDAVSRLVSQEMSHVLPLSVPLKVDLKHGRNWAEI